MISNCSELAAGADVFMNMGTYNAASLEAWMEQLAPSIAPGVPRASLGAGLGCWIAREGSAGDDTAGGDRLRPRDQPRGDGPRRLQPVPAWSLSPASAEERVCVREQQIGGFRGLT